LIVALASSTSAREAEASLTGDRETGVLVVVATTAEAVAAQRLWWQRSDDGERWGAAMGCSDGREGGGAAMAMAWLRSDCGGSAAMAASDGAQRWGAAMAEKVAAQRWRWRRSDGFGGAATTQRWNLSCCKATREMLPQTVPE
jgi:hypothetical protein